MENPIDQHKLLRFGSLEFLAKQVVEGFITGLHKSPFHGFSVEFAEHRLYNSGESTRHIDWKLFGRTEKLFVKRYEEETNLRCQLVIDHSGSMYYPLQKHPDVDHPNKFLFAVYAAASLMELMRRQRDAVGLSLFTDKLNTHTRARSNSVHHKYLLSLLEKLMQHDAVAETEKTAATEALHQVAELTHQRSLVIIFSDMMDNAEQTASLFHAMQHLRYNKHEVVLFHVVDRPGEELLDFENRPYRFVDLESRESIKLNPAQIKEAYQKEVHQRKNELMLRCGQYQIDYVESDINKGFDQVLMSYLIKRSRLY
ncbi:MAG: DUF58 domain-containing protein [Bacteroidetes bacterium]|nr:DUF58 domain-containing protein [Bacteroidota bacterium]